MKTWFSILLSLFSFYSFAQLSIVADNAQSSYEAGEAMNFLLTSSQSGMATYSIRYDRYTPPIASGTIQLTANQTAEIPFTLNEPGMVLCWVNQNNFKATGGAAFSPFDISPIEEDPVDLISFWDNLKSALAAVDMNAAITFEEDHDYSTSYRINLASIDNRRVYGYLSVPDGDGPFPAVLTVPPFGSAANIATPDFATAERTGMLAMSISIHNTEPDVVDPNSYEPDVIDNKDENYYRYAVIGAIRALDYLESRSDYDGENMAVMGVSQGGGLSLMVASLDDRVKVMANSNPALCDHTGYKYNKAGGFPYYLRKSDNEVGTQTHFDATVDATKYFDAARLAKYYEGPSLTLIGYRDTICPPATSYAAFNNLGGPKVLVQAREVGHQHPEEYQTGRYDLFRRYFPSTLSPPWPWPDNTTGYFIDATATTTTVDVGELVNLVGQVELNGSTTGNWTYNWRKIDGPGNAVFTNITTAVPTVSFDAPGTYRLAFRANDEAVAIPDKFYTVIDYITINVLCNTVSTQITEVICEGESISIGNETYTESGTYEQDLLTTLGCDSIVMLDLTVNPNPVVSLGNNAVITTDSSLTFTLDPDQFESILWNDGSTSNVFVFDGDTSGVGTFDLSVIVENEFGCFSSASLEITVEDNSNVFEANKERLEFTLSPNPTKENLTLVIKEPISTYEVRLVNCLGEEILREEYSQDDTSLDVSKLGAGLYFVLVRERGNSSFASKRVVVK